ncbi:MAG: hypothetical protein JNM42_06280 [Propionivibrio sp.]|nr:hypothetical protein [Propionivibrio sp.]
MFNFPAFSGKPQQRLSNPLEPELDRWPPVLAKPWGVEFSFSGIEM